MSTPNIDMLRAIDLALPGDRESAHQLVQQYDDDASSSWIQAVLHKMEGDLSNSQYWYRRADRMEHISDEPRAELAVIKS